MSLANNCTAVSRTCLPSTSTERERERERERDALDRFAWISITRTFVRPLSWLMKNVYSRVLPASTFTRLISMQINEHVRSRSDLVDAKKKVGRMSRLNAFLLRHSADVPYDVTFQTSIEIRYIRGRIETYLPRRCPQDAGAVRAAGRAGPPLARELALLLKQ